MDVSKRAVIDAVVEAAERCGGVCNMVMLPGKTTWSDCVKGGYLWYGFPLNGKVSTDAVKVGK